MLFFGAGVIAVNYLQIPEAKMTLVALSPSIFLVSISSVLRGYFNGRENITVTAHSQSIEQILKTILTVAIVELIGNITNNNTTIMAARSNNSNDNSNNVQLVLFVHIFYK